MTHGYDGGDGMRFWTAADYKNRDMRRPQADIIVAPMPYAMEMRRLPNPLDITGRFHTNAAAGLLRRDDRQGLHYPSAPRMNAAFNFNGHREQGLDVPGMQRRAIHQNTECWQGMQWQWNAYHKDYTTVRINTGHRGKDVYQGCARVWDGSKAETLEKQDFNRYNQA